MIKYFGLLCCLAMMLLLIACNHQPSGHKKEVAATDSIQKKSPGKIEFFTEIHNFGTVKDGEIVAFSFQFRNSGGMSIHVSNVEAGCGCIRVNYSKEEVASQAVSTIDVIFNSAGEWGNQLKTIVVETSNGETKTLKIGAFVENKNFNIDLSN